LQRAFRREEKMDAGQCKQFVFQATTFQQQIGCEWQWMLYLSKIMLHEGIITFYDGRINVAWYPGKTFK
jgi:hypothetical protein